MRTLITLTLVLLFTLSAYAEEIGIGMLVIDPDPKGTNVRETPGGAVVKVLPGAPKTDKEIEMRVVRVMERNGQWFRVRLADKSTGWMHASVLGSCASPTEDGNSSVYVEPDDASARLATLPDGTRLRLLDVSGAWARMEYSTPAGTKQAGWIMQQAMSSNPHSSCWSR